MVAIYIDGTDNAAAAAASIAAATAAAWLFSVYHHHTFTAIGPCVHLSLVLLL